MGKRALIFCLFLGGWLAYAGQEQKLDMVLEEIEEQKHQIDKIRSEQGEYSKKIDVYSKKLKNAQSRMKYLQNKYSGKSKEKRELTKQIDRLKSKIGEIKELYLLSFIRLYEAEYIEEEPINSSVLSSMVRASDQKVAQYSQKNLKLKNNTVSLNRQIRDLEQKRKKEQENITFSRYVTSAVSKDLAESKKKERQVSKKLAFFSFFLSILSCNSLHSIEICISKTQANLLSQRIFINETDLKQSKLLQWNQKENFLSLGIAHFIWYPKGQKKRFVESFPLFLTYLQKTGHTLPSWLSDTTACPWQSGKEFYSQLDSAKKKQLYKFLQGCKQEQTNFLVARLQQAIPKIIAASSQKQKVQTNIKKLSQSMSGVYAMLDYVNFKGEGLDPKESYHGRYWGSTTSVGEYGQPSSIARSPVCRRCQASAKAPHQDGSPRKRLASWLEQKIGDLL